MAPCGSLHQIFDSSRQEKPQHTLLESLSPWTQLNSSQTAKPTDETPPFTEIFGELHFKETLAISGDSGGMPTKKNINLCSESLNLCTEGLGFESSYDMEALPEGVDGGGGGESGLCGERAVRRENKKKKGEGGFPPPISSVGKIGRPWVSFRGYREEGRFVLEETRIARREFLEASREDGRLKMKLVLPDQDDDQEKEEEEEEECDEEEEANSC